EQLRVVRCVPLLARNLQVGLGLAVDVGIQDFPGDPLGHDSTPEVCSGLSPLGAPCGAIAGVRPAWRAIATTASSEHVWSAYSAGSGKSRVHRHTHSTRSP